MAREAMQPFYSRDTAWLEEGLIEEDLIIVKWRMLCHEHNRGLQQPKHIS